MKNVLGFGLGMFFDIIYTYNDQMAWGSYYIPINQKNPIYFNTEFLLQNLLMIINQYTDLGSEILDVS